MNEFAISFPKVVNENTLKRTTEISQKINPDFPWTKLNILIIFLINVASELWKPKNEKFTEKFKFSLNIETREW